VSAKPSLVKFFRCTPESCLIPPQNNPHTHTGLWGTAATPRSNTARTRRSTSTASPVELSYRLCLSPSSCCSSSAASRAVRRRSSPTPLGSSKLLVPAASSFHASTSVSAHSYSKLRSHVSLSSSVFARLGYCDRDSSGEYVIRARKRVYANSMTSLLSLWCLALCVLSFLRFHVLCFKISEGAKANPLTRLLFEQFFARSVRGSGSNGHMVVRTLPLVVWLCFAYSFS